MVLISGYNLTTTMWNCSFERPAFECWKYGLLRKLKKLYTILVWWMDVEGGLEPSEQLQNRNRLNKPNLNYINMFLIGLYLVSSNLSAQTFSFFNLGILII